MTEKLYPTLPTAPSMNYQESFHINTVRKYYQEIIDLRDKYQNKQKRYKIIYNRLLHTSIGATSVGIASGISAFGISFTVVGIPIGASLGVVSTASSGIGGILLLTSKKYKKKLLKCYELLDKITSAIATFDVLISQSLNDGTVIDANEFLKLQAIYLQVIQDVKNVDGKMKITTEENFQRTILDEIKNLKKVMEEK